MASIHEILFDSIKTLFGKKPQYWCSVVEQNRKPYLGVSFCKKEVELFSGRRAVFADWLCPGCSWMLSSTTFSWCQAQVLGLRPWIPKYKDQNQNFRSLESYKCTDPETEMSFSEASVVWLSLLSLLSHLENLSIVNTIQTRSVDPMIVDDLGVFHVS